MKSHDASRFSTAVFLCLAFLSFTPAIRAQTPFARDFAPTLTFTDTYTEVPLEIPDAPGVFDLYEKGEATVEAQLSMNGVDLGSISGETIFALKFGFAALNLRLSNDPSYTVGKTSAVLPIFGVNPDTLAAIQVGTVSLSWDALRLTVLIAVSDLNADFEIAAADDAYAEGAINDETSVTLQFADRILSERTVYYTGTGSIYSVTVGKGANRERFEDLAKVEVSGGIDSTPPAVKIENPSGNAASTLSSTITVTGNASDDRQLAKVFVRVNASDFVEAALLPSGDWSLVNVPLQQGGNMLMAKAVDTSGNEQFSVGKNIRYVVLTDLTVSASGTGFGRVASNFFATLDYTPGIASPQYQGVQEIAAALTVTAKPGAGELFDGWTSNYPLSPAQAASSSLDFLLQPSQTLTASFVSNPFTVAGAVGRYTALLQSDDPSDRGILSGTLSRTGVFTGTIRIGKLTLPIKARFNAQGQLTSPLVVWRRGVAYTLLLDLDLSENGARALTGNLSGGNIGATIIGEQTFFAKKGPKSPHAGSYSVVLTPQEGNVDAAYPGGIGSGRVKVSTLGQARFVGLLADGTPVSFSSHVAETGFWPFFAQLYGKKGSISGIVTFDFSENDLSGEVDWARPARSGAGFSGRSDVAGTRVSAKKR